MWTDTILTEIVAKLGQIESIPNNVVVISSEEDLAVLGETQPRPFIAIAYGGRGSGTKEMATVSRFNIIGVGANICEDPNGAIRTELINILDEIVQTLARLQPLGGHKLIFQSETPGRTLLGQLLYDQLWEINVNVGTNFVVAPGATGAVPRGALVLTGLPPNGFTSTLTVTAADGVEHSTELELTDQDVTVHTLSDELTDQDGVEQQL